jgi:hypothetical protein
MENAHASHVTFGAPPDHISDLFQPQICSEIRVYQWLKVFDTSPSFPLPARARGGEE